VVGSRFFACPPERPVALCDQGYLYWEAGQCDDEGWGVCERSHDDVGRYRFNEGPLCMYPIVLIILPQIPYCSRLHNKWSKIHGNR
jgi:hypothetical protein